ncbi:DUF2782 domain-containing protein [Crenobacter sp. SG2303]|uniref:DUF2782 domain-containing protein n=1 Tax=Crenobacter oryzisoli TaxID=3056844 RepID=A0ABT7XME0_9NEIS|nr:DUF2782 domain-containing protein [Crenobacter sp. SG2303]MDN0074769.1 DUF2782 domain-containing protein [Crenobacter sp. SG2303]
MRRLLFAALLVSAAIPALAATPAPSPTPSTKAEVPPPPTISDDNTGPEPEVRIIQKGKEKIEEYRMNGHLYMVKVTPAVGPAYYLIDEEGNGQLKQVNPNRRIITPQWVLKRF